jgi:hypothetical protein
MSPIYFTLSYKSFFRQGLAMYPRLASNSWSFWLSLPRLGLQVGAATPELLHKSLYLFNLLRYLAIRHG